MESPLDVLSRAASMVESNDLQRERALQRNIVPRESPPPPLPPKELPHKFNKLKRRREETPIHVQTQQADGDDSCNTKKCAGTQTPFTSFTATSDHQQSSPTLQPSSSSLVNSYSVMSSPTTSSPPPPHMQQLSPGAEQAHHNGNHHRSCSPLSNHPHQPGASTTTRSHPYSMASQQQPPRSGSSRYHQRSLLRTTNPDSNNLPLNLTMPGSGGSSQGQQHSDRLITSNSDGARATVITHAAAQFGVEYNGSRSSSPESAKTSVTEVEDPVVEEHFRRSLGINYPEAVRSSSSSSPPSAIPPPSLSTHTISSAQQVHRASAPTHITARSSPHAIVASSSSGPRDVVPSKQQNQGQAVHITDTSTVDDHFAKSLGTTWSQIQSKKEAMKLDLLTESVDDHFAKALGDTWLKIKAEKEGSSNNSTPTTPTAPHLPSPAKP